ncbi:MAG: hypothetical protein MUC87_08410 [Bacteroidia bacterium]|jgi:hypothetical protein|nr:hypothetical protein [Bacteroidia bacterium]
MNKIPTQIQPLFEFSKKNNLSCIELRFISDENDRTSLLEHFGISNINKEEFVVWGELQSDNIVLSWCKEGIELDNAPIAFIDNECAPVSVVASNPDDFLKLLPLNLRSIALITSNINSFLSNSEKMKWAENEYSLDYIKETIEYYSDTDIDYEIFLEWYNNNIKLSQKESPYNIINKAIVAFPDFHDRIRQAGLPF